MDASSTAHTVTLNGKTISFPTRLFINNEFVESVSGKTFAAIDPATEQEICQLAEGDKEDVDRAVAAARFAFEEGEWSELSSKQRGDLLYRLAELIDQEKEALALLESLDVGKPYFESFNFDLKQVVDTYRYFAGWADKIHGKSIDIPGNNVCYTRHEPLGVVGLIVPWNFPLQITAWKLAPALAAGNTVILKPAEQTSITALKLAELVKKAGFPAGVVNVITGFGPKAGAAIAAHMDIDKVSFTGSTFTGRKVMELSAASNLKPVGLELGGKSPIIVFDDVINMEKAITDSYYALFWNAGQCCSAGSRIFVHEKIYDEFVEKSVAMAKARIEQTGNPLLDTTMQGPQVSKLQFDKVMGYIETGKKEGARLLCGGARVGDKGYFIQPTVFADVEDNMTICREEIFGPVMAIIKFKDVHEVVRRANDSIYGLVAAVYTRDVEKAMFLSKKLKAGTVWVNTYNVITPQTPWGGFKQSGHGRDMSEYALAQYTAPKCVIIEYQTPKM